MRSRRDAVESRAVGVYGQVQTCAGHCHIIATQPFVSKFLPSVNEHEHIVKLASLGLVYGRHDNLVAGCVMEILHFRFEQIFAEVAVIFVLVGLLKQFNTSAEIREGCAPPVFGKGLVFCLCPRFLTDDRRRLVPGETFGEISHLRQIAEPQVAHCLYEFGHYSLSAQQRHDRHSLLVGLRKHACGALQLARCDV